MTSAVAERQSDEPFVFISYSRVDRGYVIGLTAHLSDNEVPCWIDERVEHGDRWPRELRARVDTCAALIVVMSPASSESVWVEREVLRAEQRDKPVLPLLLDGEPFFELSTHQYEEVVGSQMPTQRFIERLRHLTSMEPSGSPSGYRYWLDEGQRHTNLADFGSAIDAFDTAIAADPTSPEPWAGKARALYRLGRNSEALEAADQAVQLDPTNGRAHQARGAALSNLGDHEDALAAYDRAIELAPKDALAGYNRGLTLQALGRHHEALAAYNHAIELDPDDDVAHNDRGVTLAGMGRLGEALAAFDRAIALNQGNVHAHNNRGKALQRQERHHEALVAFNLAIELDHRNANHHNRAVSLRELGQLEDALAAFEWAIRLAPERDDFRQSRQDLLDTLDH